MRCCKPLIDSISKIHKSWTLQVKIRNSTVGIGGAGGTTWAYTPSFLLPYFYITALWLFVVWKWLHQIVDVSLVYCILEFALEYLWEDTKFQKISILPHWREWHFLGGWSLRPKHFKKCIKLNWNVQRGCRGEYKKTFLLNVILKLIFLSIILMNDCVQLLFLTFHLDC